MSTVPSPPTNFERLKQKLKKDSLAARLVEAQMTVGTGAGQTALRKVVADRLDELRKKHGGPADHRA
jgi:ribose 5-phosphate isomerase